MKENEQNAVAENSEQITRREALAKLAQFSAYAAPTVVTLLAAKPSLIFAASATPPPPANNCPSGTENYNQNENVPSGPHDQAANDGSDTLLDCNVM